MGWSGHLKSRSFRATWSIILLIGIVISSAGIKPVSVIWLAQVANGILLPVMAGFIWWLCNKPHLGSYRNNTRQNLLAGVIMLVSLLLSGKSLMAAFF
jgi:Mn2+/Fe2+ NRAMP family transporter